MARMRRTNKHWLAALCLLVPIAAPAQSGPLQLGCGWSGGWPMVMGASWGLWWLVPLTMFALMVLMVAFFVLHGPWSQRGRQGSALMLLGERFARGEISSEEFEEKKAILVRPI